MKWTAIRVSQETKEMLDKVRAAMQDHLHQLKNEPHDLPLLSGKAPKRDVVGFDQVIRYLLRDRRRKAARRAKAIAKKRKAGPPAADVATKLTGQVLLPGFRPH